MAAVYNWPDDFAPSTCNLRLVSNRKQYKSPSNGAIQTEYRPGSSWKMTLTFQDRDDDESRILESLMYILDTGGRIRIPDFGRPGVNRTGITVFGGGQVGPNLVTQGWPPNTQQLIRKGDYFEIGDELKFITADASSDAAGRVTLQFSPWLRNSPQSGAPVNVKTPCGYFKLDADDNGPDRKPAFANTFNITFTESFY